ncbi:hypothetical protein HK101_003866, partial [Irineochytrium annulatum]
MGCAASKNLEAGVVTTTIPAPTSKVAPEPVSAVATVSAAVSAAVNTTSPATSNSASPSRPTSAKKAAAADPPSHAISASNRAADSKKISSLVDPAPLQVESVTGATRSSSRQSSGGARKIVGGAGVPGAVEAEDDSSLPVIGGGEPAAPGEAGTDGAASGVESYIHGAPKATTLSRTVIPSIPYVSLAEAARGTHKPVAFEIPLDEELLAKSAPVRPSTAAPPTEVPAAAENENSNAPVAAEPRNPIKVSLPKLAGLSAIDIQAKLANTEARWK